MQNATRRPSAARCSRPEVHRGDVRQFRTTGTLESEWADADRWQRLPRYARPIEHLVVLAAHPDDETLGAGGLIESAGRDGARISIVVATDGEASHPASPTHTPWQLSRIRRREMRKAIDHLAPDAVIHHCEIPDGQLIDHVDEVVDCVAGIVDDVGGTATIVAPWSGDGHRDHRAAAAAARAAAESTGSALLEYPIWMWHWGRPDDDSLPWSDMVAIDLDADTRMAKSSALHRARQPDRSALGPGRRRGRDRRRDAQPLRAAVRGVLRGRHSAAERRRPRPGRPRRRMPPLGDGTATLERDFFDSFYAGRDDPWGFETRWYEKRKRDILLASLPHERYATALEVGCSTGKLTASLAWTSRCAAGRRHLAGAVARGPEAPGRSLERGPARGIGADRVARWSLRPRRPLRGRLLLESRRPRSRPRSGDRTRSATMGPWWPATGGIRSPSTPSPATMSTPRSRHGPELVATVQHREEDFVLEVFRRPPGGLRRAGDRILL